MADQPRLSILIPNYNNGAASSKDGRRNFIDDLLRSIDETLRNDRTHVEILIADDGSTDDSPETIRRFVGGDTHGQARTTDSPLPYRRDRFFPMEHRGVVSRCMNLLLREARGDIFCRFDGDTIIHTPNWASILCEKFEQADPAVGIIGAKQLRLNGRVHSMGDWVLHPRGYHHVGQGAARDAFVEDIEVDHVMGCFYACRRAVYESVGDYDESILRGQTIDWTISARSRGWRVVCTPDIEFTHCHSERAWRANEADTPAGLNGALDRFREKWGFDRLAPDLDVAQERHRNSPLLWNREVFGDGLTERNRVPIAVEQSSWARLANDDQFRQAISRRVQMVMELLADQRREVDTIAHLACGDGLLTHLLAEQGLPITGVDESPLAASFAREMCTKAACAHPTPKFMTAGRDPRVGRFSFVLLADSIEIHPNPVALFAAARQLLASDGCLIVVSQERPSPIDEDSPGLHRYRAHELNAQLVNTRQFRLHTPALSRPDGVLLAVAQPVAFGAAHGHFSTEPKPAHASVCRAAAPGVASSLE